MPAGTNPDHILYEQADSVGHLPPQHIGLTADAGEIFTYAILFATNLSAGASED